MPKNSHKTDKNENIDQAITRLNQSINEAGYNIVEQSCLNPIANVWLVKISDKECNLLFANGKGKSKKLALLNALFQFIQNLAMNRFWADYYLGDEISHYSHLHSTEVLWVKTVSSSSWPDNILNNELQSFYDPEDALNPSLLIDINSSNPDRGICCIPFKNLHSDNTVNFPVNIIDNIYAYNGVSSAETKDEARVKAISEILERYVQCKIIAEGISLPDIPMSVLDKYPLIQTNSKELEKTGYSLLIKDASLNGKYPVVCMILLSSENQKLHISFNANPNFEVALDNCFMNLFQQTKSNKVDCLTEPGFDLDEISNPNNLINALNRTHSVVAWDFLNDNSSYEFVNWRERFLNDRAENDQFTKLCDIISEQGNDIYINENYVHDIYTCRIIVPGMSEIYPLDDLIWENSNKGMHVRDQILKINKTSQECGTLIEDLEDLNLDDDCLVSTLIGLAVDEDNIFSDLCIAELILLLALKTQDNERMQEGCEWLLHFKQINPRRLKTYKCINTLLQLDGMIDYATTLEKLYSREILNDALALIDGEDVFPLSSDWKVHASLLEAYKKQNAARI